jgi:hypothetical protein
VANAEGTNFERLKNAGLILEEPLSEDHQAVVDGLTRDEVDILVSIKTRLDEADESQGLAPPQPGELPGFTTYVIF